jgi:hypothetical protein
VQGATMTSKNLKWIYKMILAMTFLCLLKTLKEWSYSVDSAILKPRDIHNEFKLMENTKRSKRTKVDKRTKVLNYHAFDEEKKSEEKTQSERKLSNMNLESIYGLDCPLNPHKPVLNYLFNYWMTLDNYHNFSSFLCGGSLLGSMRDGDLIPYDRDIDVCVTLKNYHKVRALRSQKPFRFGSGLVYLAVQEDFFNNHVSNRTMVDCKGRIVKDEQDLPRDPCSFESPGARLISRKVYVDVFVLREHGGNLRDHEYDKELLKTDIFPLKDCMFMGAKTKCPRNKTSLLLKYYEPDALTKPHYKCRNKTWLPTSEDATKQFSIWFDKRLKRFYSL